MKEPWVLMEHHHGPDKTYSGFVLPKMWSEIEYANLGTDLHGWWNIFAIMEKERALQSNRVEVFYVARKVSLKLLGATEFPTWSTKQTFLLSITL